MLLSIKKDAAPGLDFKDVTSEFMAKKARRVMLLQGEPFFILGYACTFSHVWSDQLKVAGFV